MKFDAARWQVMNTILDELLDLPEFERLPKLKAHCKEDNSLFGDILKLLKECEAEPGLLDQNALNLAHTLMDELAPSQIPSLKKHALQNQQMGAYQLQEEIGRGGMGVVYKAIRSQGDYNHTVAIKVLQHVSANVIERFRREQQALATLKHPNITQLLDAGVTDAGLPYLIMEFIEGDTITDYCLNHALNTQQRLELLDQVLEALAFCHKYLIVHRDIKPSNIMVTKEGNIKLLDFSIAKLLDADLALEETATNMHLLTPSYAAPEQVLNQTVTIATDIYQLGLLYYRILTGRKPFPKEVSSLHELVNLVCEQEVTRPSQILRCLDGLEEAMTDPHALSKLLKGDLDAIVLKMLRKEPSARYPSIEALNQDIYAYHHFLPVQARRADWKYHATKYVRRHWRALSLAALASTGLLIYAVSMQLQNTRVKQALAQAEQEQHKAEQVSQFLIQTFDAADPNQGGLKGVTAYDLLEQARTKINEQLKDAPEVQAPLLNIFSRIYFRQKDFQKAEALLVNFLDNPKTSQQLDTALLAEVKLRLAQQKIGLSEYSEAEVLLRDSMALQVDQGIDVAQANPLYAETLTFLARALLAQNRHAEAINHLQQAIEHLKNIGEAGDRLRSFALNILANHQFSYENLDSAILNMREALAIKQRILGLQHTETSNTQLILARYLIDRGDFAEAETLAQTASINIKNQLPETHPYQAFAVSILAKLAQRQNKFEAALTILKSSPLLKDHQNVTELNMSLYFSWLDILLDLNRLAEATQLMDKIDDLARTTSLDGFAIGKIMTIKGRIHLMKQEYGLALSAFNKSLTYFDSNQTDFLLITRDKAIAKLQLDHFSEALDILMAMDVTMRQRFGLEHPQVRVTCAVLQKMVEQKPESLIPKNCTSIHLNVAEYVPEHIRQLLTSGSIIMDIM